MSNFYYDQPAIANIPKCTSIKFLSYLERFRRFRRAQALAMLNGTTVYYFSTSGSDAANGLTEGTAKKTIGAAQTILTAWNNAAAGLVLKFKCGDIWDVDGAGEGKLDFSSKYNVAITNYGDKSLGLPFFSRWKAPVRLDAYETSVGRADAFSNTYSVAKPGAESWYTIRPYGRKDVAFRHMASIAEVDANPGTVWIDHAGTGKMYFRPLSTRTQLFEHYEGLTPDPTMTVAMIGNNNTTGVLATGKVAVVGVEISGVCIGAYGSEATAANAIHLRGYADASLYVLDSCITYSSRHHIVTASGAGGQPSTQGTILFVDNCSIGWQSSQSGCILVTANSLEGGSEMFCSNNTILGGNIPRPDVTNGGTAIISHTSGAPYVTLLDIIYNCHATGTPGQISTMGGYSDMSDPGTDIKACRHFIVKCSIPHRSKYVNDNAFDGVNRWSAFDIGQAQVVINSYVGCTQLGSPNNTGANVNPTAQEGHYVNCTFSIDLGLDQSRPASDVAHYHSSVNSVLFSLHSCMLETKNVLAGRFAWVASQLTNGTLPAAANIANRCLFVNRSSPVRNVSFYHNAVFFGFRTEQCGYSGISRYFTNGLVANVDYKTVDSLYVIADEIPDAGGVPDELAVDSHSYVTFGGTQHLLEYDADGMPRLGRNALGPRRVDAPFTYEGDLRPRGHAGLNQRWKSRQAQPFTRSA